MQKNPKDILKQFWGYSDFRGSQEHIITKILERKDVLALLPTGGGKSICYQIPALVKEGICIVVSPLVALIQDQVNSLQQKGIKALALTGGISFEEFSNLLDNCIYGNYKFLYLSPERLQQDIVKERILQMNVNLIAIDEAHCISQWGNDFRPAYNNCSLLRNLLPNVPIIALTATATKKVAQDIVENLCFENEVLVKDSFSRDNIIFNVVWDEDKDYKLLQLCKNNQSSIVYVRSRRLAEQLSKKMNAKGLLSDFFHGGNSKKEKAEKLQNWIGNKIKIIVATNAFGMGIDKPDVRLVVHYQIPDSIENYFQEAGRAGRDGKPSTAVLLLNKEDEQQVKRQFLSTLPNVSFLKLLYNKLNNYFQIPYGDGSQQSFKLNFNSFCSIYKLNTMLTYNGLKILDQYSVLSLSENFSKQATVQFLGPKHQLQNYIDNNQHIAPTIQTVLRTYGGLFEYGIKINTVLIGKKANVSETSVLKTLEQLEKDNIITYTAQHNDLEVTFLVPREDEKTINVFAKEVKKQQQLKTDRIEKMLTYINNNKKCRNVQLLSYFNEAKERCGQCDVCTKDDSINDTDINEVKREIIKNLKIYKMTSRSLIDVLPYQELLILQSVQLLLEENLIEVNTMNQYQLK